ncbi:MAG: SUMF1/EgtB/PvdO family nonheme iron enzyme [Verrucomicrobiota bacterium]
MQDDSNNPSIPNFDILGRIGGGAYGEVYLARSVTGMYRALKVVRREDFEYEKTFEREFEGIQHYEKVSQDHPGLVDVLHVGRDRDAGFYYYVMELADDARGSEVSVEPETYKARTLSSEIRRNPIRPIRECIELGITIAGGLGHLHQSGLTHRDVKPSNIIFVKGVPKLADVGLVAHSGQRTYVGTEGYVPPEGPGTSSADLYSLAMVLYEMHTGKDRLEFPELPTNLEIPPTVNRDEWRSINAVICRAGSPDPRKRFDTAHSFALALREVVGVDAGGRRQRKSKGGVAAVFATLIIFGAVAGIGYWLWQDTKEFRDQNSTLLAQTDQEAGDESASTQVNKPVVEPETEPESTTDESPEVEMPPDEGPVVIQDPPSETALESAEPEKENPPSGDESSLSEPEKTMGEDAGEGPTLDSGEEDKNSTSEPEGKMEPASEEVDDSDDEATPPLVAREVKAEIKIMSEPSGATIWIEGKEIDRTEALLTEIPLGAYELILKHPDFRDTTYRGVAKEGLQLVNIRLIENRGPVGGAPWLNGIGMVFESNQNGAYVSVQPVSVEAFGRFLEASQLAIPVSGFQGIAQVRDEKALWAFCDWMTRADQRTGYLGGNEYYRPIRFEGALSADAFYVTIDNRFGALLVNSAPVPSIVYLNGVEMGTTPQQLQDVRFGPYRLEFHSPGYAIAVEEGIIEKGEVFALTPNLTRDASVVFGESWSNSQRMTLRPVGDLLVAEFETRVRDYRQFVTESGLFSMPPISLVQGLNHPIVGVTLAEAQAFCDWLTQKEQSLGLLRPWQRYRLPTDLEWSRLSGMEEETGATPEERGRSGALNYSWGTEWPPPEQVGNFADLAAVNQLGRYVIEGYTDGFPTTSPVGSFQPSSLGLQDVAGNVWEWVSDPYSSSSQDFHVVRGGGWESDEASKLRLSYRNFVPPDARQEFFGFRYVLVDGE